MGCVVWDAVSSNNVHKRLDKNGQGLKLKNELVDQNIRHLAADYRNSTAPT